MIFDENVLTVNTFSSNINKYPNYQCKENESNTNETEENEYHNQ